MNGCVGNTQSTMTNVNLAYNVNLAHELICWKYPVYDD